MDSMFFRELVRRKADTKLNEALKKLEYNEITAAQIALGGMKVCRELERDMTFHLESMQRAVAEAQRKSVVREERREMRRLARQGVA